MIRIGNIHLKNPLFLAPMVDVTDLPYRLICRKAGAAMAYTEMLNIGAILHENEKTKNLMKTSKKDKPLGIQITGPAKNDFKMVLPHLKPYNLVDINCGCPAVRITDNASGSFLLKEPKKIFSFIRILKNAGYVTTAKIRLGFNENNVMKIAKEIERAGADALTIHARLARQSNKIPADWTWIKKVKHSVGIPIIGNGDISTGKHVAQMLEIADGAMIARAAIGDPLIFKRILFYLKTGKEREFDFKSSIKYLAKYIEYAKKYEIIDIHRIKKVGCTFFRNASGSAKLRAKFMSMKNYEEINQLVRSLI